MYNPASLVKKLRLSKRLYFSQTSINHGVILEKHAKSLRDDIFKLCNVKLDNCARTQSYKRGGHSVSSASLLALPGFLTYAFGASIFSDYSEDLGNGSRKCLRIAYM